MAKIRIYGEIGRFNALIQASRKSDIEIIELPDPNANIAAPNAAIEMLGSFVSEKFIFINVDEHYEATPLTIEPDGLIQITWDEDDDPMHNVAFIDPMLRTQEAEVHRLMVIPRD